MTLSPDDDYLEQLDEERKRGLTSHENELIEHRYDGKQQTTWQVALETVYGIGEWAVTSILVWILLVTLIFGGLAMYSVNKMMKARNDKINELNRW